MEGCPFVAMTRAAAKRRPVRVSQVYRHVSEGGVSERERCALWLCRNLSPTAPHIPSCANSSTKISFLALIETEKK